MMDNPYADRVDMTALYTNLIQVWANSGESGGPQRAEEILDYFQRFAESGDSYDPLLCGPDVDCYNAVIGAYAGSGRADATEQAMRVLGKLYDLHHAGRTVVAPNKDTYAHILRAWAKKASPDSPEWVRRILMHMEQLSESFPLVKPDTNCHNSYLSALLECVNRGLLDPTKGARLAEDYLYLMLSRKADGMPLPDKWSFNLVLSAWSRSGASFMLDRSEALVAKFEAYHEESGRSEETQPNSHTYNTLMSCYTRSGVGSAAEKTHIILRKMKELNESGDNPAARPDTISYNIVMNAYAKTRRKDAPYKVEDLLRQMNEEYNRTGDQKVKPNNRSINACLEAWAKCGVAGSDKRVWAWIERMHENYRSGRSKLVPDKFSYNNYLQAMSKTGSPGMGREAERVLAEMESFHRKGYPELKPDVLTFTNVLHCIALGGEDDAVERAISILDRMEDLHSQGCGDVRPNLFTYNCVINTIAKSKRLGKAQLALQILRRLQSVALKPTTISFNNVLNACAFSNHKDDDTEAVIQIALDVLREAQEGTGANWITYHTTIRVLCSLEEDPENRWRLIREIFRQCCDDGQLTRTVLTQVRFAVSDERFKLLDKEATDARTKKFLDKFTVNARREMRANKTKAVSA
jgi:hypothetical protein